MPVRLGNLQEVCVPRSNNDIYLNGCSVGQGLSLSPREGSVATGRTIQCPPDEIITVNEMIN